MIKLEKVWRSIILFIYTIIIIISTTSCTGSREMQTIAIVTSMAVDLIENDKIVVTCEIVNPTSGGGTPGGSAGTSTGSSNLIFAQEEGETVFEALRNISLNFDRKLFFSHVNVLIFGEEFAKHGISEFMDMFLRDNELREDMYILIAKESKAYDVLGVKGEFSQSAGNYVNDVLSNSLDSGKSLRISIAEYYRYYYEVSNEPVLGIVRKKKKNIVDEDRKKENPEKTILEVDGAAVLKRDYLVGYFSPDETLGYNFITDRIKSGLIIFDIDEALKDHEAVIGKEGNLITVEILSSSTKRKIDITDDKINLNIDIKIKGSLGEVNKAIYVGNLDVVKALENACSKKVESFVMATMDKGQKQFMHDNFSIGEFVHRQYPQVWKEIAKDWKNIFPDISYSVNVHTDIVKTGIINVPSNLRKR